KIAMIQEKRKKQLEERIRQAEEELTTLSAGNKHEQSNNSTPPLSLFTAEMDTEEIALEKKLRELEQKKATVLKERKKKELKEKIRQLEKDLLVMESEHTQEEANKCIFCTDVLRNTQKLGCGHELCSKCVGEAFEFQKACPECGTKFMDDVGLSSDALISWHNSSDFIENS
ncbi:hypothetical protein CHS0354_016656, partial [Potamilus streckersoni]